MSNQNMSSSTASRIEQKNDNICLNNVQTYISEPTIEQLSENILKHIQMYCKLRQINQINSISLKTVPQNTTKILLSIQQILTKLLPLQIPSISLIKTPTNQANTHYQKKIKSLQNINMETQRNFKNIQLKLLRNIKKLSQEISEKDLKIGELEEILVEREEEVETLRKINEKKYRKIRELEEDIYDLQDQIKNIGEQLQLEKQSSMILQEKLTKMQSQTAICDSSLDKCTTQIQIQTDIQSNLQQKKLSQFLQSKETKYLQSIQRLTFELSEAYERINQLSKHENISLAKKIMRKTRTTSSYFGHKK